MVFLVFILIATDMFLNVLLHAGFYHVVLVDSDILSLAWTLIVGKVLLTVLIRF